MESSLNKQKPDFLINGILSGDVATLSRAITLAESANEKHRVLAEEVLEAVIGHSGKSLRLGITGVPGVGKSTFIESFGKEVVNNGHKLAVLAIDPSSAKSKGSILGDKTRMEELSTMKNVFIRPSPSGGELGGITRTTYETILLCEAAGFDFVIVETVGVGQSEVTVDSICDFFLLLMLAGAGDELQGIKRGIMEMADALIITKADGANLNKAKAARLEYAHAMHLLQAPESGWTPRTAVCSGTTGLGIKEVYNMLLDYKVLAKNNGFFAKKRKQQQLSLLFNNINEQLKKQFYSNHEVKKRIEFLKNAETFQPFNEAKKLLYRFFKDSE